MQSLIKDLNNIEMFGSLKNKFHSLQEGISASLRGLIVTESNETKNTFPSRPVNLNAGADILYRFQSQWNESHDIAEQNAATARRADELITSIHDKLNEECNNIVCLNNALTCIPKINEDIQTLMNQIGTLQESFEEVEASLCQMENLNETLELQNRQLDHRFQLALYKEKKLSELSAIKVQLETEHLERVSKHERKQQKTLKERRETFDQVFKDEIKEYRATGSLPKVAINQHGPSLEDIVLDVDSKGFDEFLES